MERKGAEADFQTTRCHNLDPILGLELLPDREHGRVQRGTGSVSNGPRHDGASGGLYMGGYKG